MIIPVRPCLFESRRPDQIDHADLGKAELRQLRPKHVGVGQRRGEDREVGRHGERARRIGRQRREEILHAACHGRRRIEPRDRGRRHRLELGQHEAVMRAAEHDRVERSGAGRLGQNLDLLAQHRAIDREAAEALLGERRQALRAVREHGATLGKFFDQLAQIFAANRSRRREQADRLRPAHLGGELDRRHAADERHRKARAQRRQRDRRRRVASDDDGRGRQHPVERGDDARAALDDRRIGEIAVGKAAVVGDIDDVGRGQEPADLARHTEAADAGIDHRELAALRLRALAFDDAAGDAVFVQRPAPRRMITQARPRRAPGGSFVTLEKH